MDCYSEQTFVHKQNCGCRVLDYQKDFSYNLRKIRFKCFFLECRASLSFSQFFEHYQHRGCSSSGQPRLDGWMEFEKILLEKKSISEQLDNVQKKIDDNSSKIENLLQDNERLTCDKNDLEKKLKSVTEREKRARKRPAQFSSQGSFSE